MDRPLISIIVPVYNVEPYLPRCVDSILAQTYGNIEVILVNDGSTDSSGKLCEDYARRDTRIHTIHKANEGLADARNQGIRASAGVYCSFVDSDDYIAEDCIAYLYHMARENCAQIAVCGYQKVDTQKGYTDGRIRRKKNDTDKAVRVYDSCQALEALLYQRGIIASAWGRLFQKELFSELAFPKGRQHEDVAVMYRLFEHAGTIAIGDAKKYYYRQRPDSIVHSAFDERRMDYILFTQECIAYMQNRHPELVNAAISRHFSACFELLASIGKEKKAHGKAYGRLVQEVKKYRKTVLSDHSARTMNRMAALGTYLSVAAVQKLCCIKRDN
ncbi:MAG: glycosyltransferase [Lachnospiraceae bacterium]|nr:glycosyltransferase [Lachnospiraceae bacterium]